MCKNCEKLKESGLCPAICKGSLLELKEGMRKYHSGAKNILTNS
jgi:hypothetical protein